MRSPCVAVWLIDQFAAPDQREAMLGDLQEEFAAMATERGIRSARRWFRRQTARTLVHLIATSVRQHPARLVMTVAAGFWVWWMAPVAVDEGVRKMLDRWQVYHYIDAYTFWLLYAVLMGNVLVPALVGLLLALSNDGQEWVASAGLAAMVLVCTGGIVVQHVYGQQHLVQQFPDYKHLWHTFTMMQIQLAICALLTAVSLCIGGLMVRRIKYRNRLSACRCLIRTTKVLDGTQS